MLNKNALIFSLIFTTIEIAIFLLLSIPGSLDQEGHIIYRDLLSKIIPNLANLFIAIATTWYVIFTYYILKSNEIIRRIATEPYLSINWGTSPSKEALNFENYSSFSEEFARDFNLMQKDIEHGNRYVTLILQNVQAVRLGRIEIGIEITIDFNEKIWNKKIINYNCDNLNLGQSDLKKITVLDLRSIPRNAQVKTKLVNLQYNPINSRIVLSGFTGIDMFNCNGIAEYEEIIPKPQLSVSKEESKNG